MAKRGIIFFPDHIRVARGLLNDAEIGSLFLAIADYAEKGEADTDGHSQAWNVCFGLMCAYVDDNASRYLARCERNRQNANRRWKMPTQDPYAVASDGNTSHAIAYGGMRSHAMDAKQSKANQSKAKQSGVEADIGMSPPAASSPPDPPWVEETVAGIPQIQRAEQLMLRYKLPDSDVSLEALLEDIDKHGEQTVEQALKDASASNSRPRLSINYYRAVLNGRGRSDVYDDGIRV